MPGTCRRRYATLHWSQRYRTDVRLRNRSPCQTYLQPSGIQQCSIRVMFVWLELGCGRWSSRLARGKTRATATRRTRQQSKRANCSAPTKYLVLEPRTRGDKGTIRIYSIYARQQREATAERVSGVVRKYVLFKVLSVPLSHKRRHQVQTENIHV